MEIYSTNNLIDLPKEVLINILKKLDFKSKLNVYNTCQYMRHLICLQGVCQVYPNCFNNARILQLSFIKDISLHLTELNMTGVHSLFNYILVPSLKEFKALKTLDVSYTPINISDLLNIYESCPTIKDISINFITRLCNSKMLKNNAHKFQDVLENFENIHFVGFDLMFTYLVFLLLMKANLNKLEITDYYGEYPICVNADLLFNPPPTPKFRKMVLNLPCGGFILDKNVILSRIDMDKHEFLVKIQDHDSRTIAFASEVFSNFSPGCVELESITLTYFRNMPLEYFGPLAIVMIWEKDATEFDSVFFADVVRELKQCWPYRPSPGNRDFLQLLLDNINTYENVC